MKSILRKIIPRILLNQYRYYFKFKDDNQNRNKTTEEVFTDIYKLNKWGGRKGEFYSGAGSAEERIVSAYISTIYEKAAIEKIIGKTFIDLGCGDFRVGIRLLPLCSHYIGVDIVKTLIQENQRKYGNNTATFQHLNIVEDKLPNGEVCFLRQVLQHLSNMQINTILNKIQQYRWVFITEHYPTYNDAIIPNIDKVHGGDIRGRNNSGVYLTEQPFNLPKKALEQILEIAGTKLEEGIDPGVIRTFLYKPIC